MSDTLVKHSDRTLRKACKNCGKGGASDPENALYWAHDTAKRYHADCDKCGVNGAFVLMERDGTRHVCGTKTVTTPDLGEVYPETPITTTEDGIKIPTPVTPTVQDYKKEVSTVAPAGNDVQAALELLMGALSPTVDRAEIESMVKQAVADVVYPTRTVIERADGERKELSGKTHHKVADVITCLLAGEHVLMVGPAGTGKSTIAEQAAEALDLAYASISLSPQTPASQLVGYMQATGQYVGTLFRERFENGGVFHFDEMDNAHPSVLATINAALANGQMAFPDGMVRKHADFKAVASANTYGRGADRAYVGRQALDAATLDRFTIETVDVDESLETELAHSVGLEKDQVDRVLKFVRKVRANVVKHSMPLVISPRATMGMVRLLAAGRSWESAVDARVRRGMSDTEWLKVTA